MFWTLCSKHERVYEIPLCTSLLQMLTVAEWTGALSHQVNSVFKWYTVKMWPLPHHGVACGYQICVCVCVKIEIVSKKRWEKIHARGTSFILLQHCVSCELVYFVKGMYQIYIVPRDSGISTLVDVHIIFFVMFQSLSEHSESDFYPAY